jgi:uncharacterized protein (DUF1800 family)
MTFHPRSALAMVSLGIALIIQIDQAAAKRKKHDIADTGMPARERAVHALNRLSFGPRPGDIDRVTAMGTDAWIEQQLHPEKIDDSALESRLVPLRTLYMDAQQTAREFPSGQTIKAVLDGKVSMPSDPEEHDIYQLAMVRYQDKKHLVPAATQEPPVANAMDGSMSAPVAMDEDAAAHRSDSMFADAEAQQLLTLPPEQRLNAVLKLSTADQISLISDVKGEKRERILEGVSPQQREVMLALGNPQQVVNDELVEGKLLRAIYSQRQLQEVMADFWFNHFNVFIGKGADRYMLADYERDVIRPHALGKFEDLLVATAQSPAMLFYLDNWLSVGPDSDFANGNQKRRADGTMPTRKNNAKRNGLNENYGRELLELHTLGVNGGYTQKDVTEVAKVLTGWTLREPARGGGFEYNERRHEPGDKMVLGHRIKENGEKEGYEVLHILAHDPATAKFICTKLAMRFVSDKPDPALVDRMADTFLKKDGDIREVLRTIFKSPEFWALDAYRAKVKTPFEFAVSAIRATDAAVSNALPISRQLQNMGMPLYGMQPPTGYSMEASTWVNSSALLGRMNFSLTLASGKMRGTSLDIQSLLGATATQDPDHLLTLLENSLLAGDISRQTHDTISAQLQDPKITQRKLDDSKNSPNAGVIAGLILGSPEFQKR